MTGRHLGEQLARGVAGEEGALQRQLCQYAAQGPGINRGAICQPGTCHHLHGRQGDAHQQDTLASLGLQPTGRRLQPLLIVILNLS